MLKLIVRPADVAAKIEEQKIRGKILAEYLGHPEWQNVCLACGEIEIPVDQKECEKCATLKFLSGAG